MRHYPLVVGLNLLRILDNPLRAWMEEAVYNLLGRPFDKVDDYDVAELEHGGGGGGGIGDVITSGGRMHLAPPAFDEEEDEFEEEKRRSRRRTMWNKAIKLGISFGVTSLTAILWLPLDVVSALVLENPHTFESPIQCAKQLWAAEGWKGFYRAAPFFFLGFLPYDTFITILGEK